MVLKKGALWNGCQVNRVRFEMFSFSIALKGMTNK